MGGINTVPGVRRWVPFAAISTTFHPLPAFRDKFKSKWNLNQNRINSNARYKLKL
jgi:hypothetical protein